jgi:hypothetical protein
MEPTFYLLFNIVVLPDLGRKVTQQPMLNLFSLTGIKDFSQGAKVKENTK